MKPKKISMIFSIGIVVITSFLLAINTFATKKLSLDLSKYHFGSQNPSNKSMPKGLELARPWIFNWNNIEKTKGIYSWEELDKQYKKLQKKKFKTLGVIIPFVKWDQLNRSNYNACKTNYESAEKIGIEYICNPNDWSAYRQFLTRLVDRYDGDGESDMPGLKIPIKAWEIWNEPEFQGDFYIGTPREYAKLMSETYKTIKKEDKNAVVLNGGIAGMTKDISFWKKVFKLKNGRKFDVLSYHCITCESETASIKEFNEWVGQTKVNKKRIWLTEWQIGRFEKEGSEMTDEEIALTLVKGASYAFANKVDKIFMVELNYMFGHKKSKQALKTLIRKLKNFKSAREHTRIELPNGQVIAVYEFKMPNNRTILIGWGGGELTVGSAIYSVTDIYGNPVTVENNVVPLGDMPYIIEAQ